MAPDGHCKFGDANGDGYVRSEGAAVVLLKRLPDALADGDPVRAVIRGSAVNNDGRTSGHLGHAEPQRPSGRCCAPPTRRTGVDPHQVGYVEAHGTGTSAGRSRRARRPRRRARPRPARRSTAASSVR